MKLITQSPKKVLKAFLKQKPLRSEIDLFKTNLITLLDKKSIIEKRPNDESEEHLKNDLRDFLRDTYYKDTNAINTKDKKDLVIHLSKSTDSEVGVIIEAKRPANTSEMISGDNANKKALHELILYYLDERNRSGNNQLKHLVVTNVNEWYIIDANYFDKHIYRNTQIKKLFETKLNDKKDNPFFYEEIAKVISKMDIEIPCVYFDIRHYDKVLRNGKKEDDRELIALYKMLSPQHLLKAVTLNDSNSLDKKFYEELLHIIGLEEVKENGKYIIRRKKDNRNPASLLESTIDALITIDPFHKLPDQSLYGNSKEEKLFNVALELCITWINRILFLKLLEGQLVSYHQGDKEYCFLNSENIHNYDELFKLFHKVLAVNVSERSDAIKEKYSRVPYLNSSLFEISPLEDFTLQINSLDDSLKLPFSSKSVLKEATQKRGGLLTLDYLFCFLDTYDFASDGTEDVQEDNKTIINASVLGKVFEKINGYKDGSIFTPAFITMYMSEQTIRLAVLKKFNDALSENGINSFDKFDDIKNYTSKLFKSNDILRANEIVNSLRICDPAVGSGHFLVSALNEIISIKSKLGILADENGNSLNGYEIEIINDELLITDHQGNIVEYKLSGGKPINKEMQRLQKALFHEKQTIIENCLFGVDVNPNSVKICSLRLWIELLKNAYYIEETGYSELETLPNIDINIKCGNSLLSRFSINEDLSKALKSIKYDIKAYRGFVNDYKNEKSRDVKRQLHQIIDNIKNDFRTEISNNDPKKKRLSKLSKDLFSMITVQNSPIQVDIIKGGVKKEKEKRLKLEKEIEKLSKEIDEIKNNAVYKNAFEWRFEFPEVLNNNGDFVGFDVIVGNPPYMRVQEIEKTQPLQKKLYEKTYNSAKGAFDLANLFFELAVNISNNISFNAYIFPHKFLNADSGTAFRDYLMNGKYIDKLAHFGANMIFDNADTYTCIAMFSKYENDGIYFQRFPFKSNYKELIYQESNFQFLTYGSIRDASQLYGVNNWILFDSEKGFDVFRKIYQQEARIKDKFEIFVGLQTSKDEIYVLELLKNKGDSYEVRVPFDNQIIEVETEFFKPFLMGKEVQKYETLMPKSVVFFPYKLDSSLEIVSEEELQNQYPNTHAYLMRYSAEFKKRESGKANKMKVWYAYIYPKNLNKFEQPKLSCMEICSNNPNVTLNYNNYYHTTKVYSWVKLEGVNEDYKYFLAISNSKLLWWFLKNTGDTLQGDARTFKTNYLYPFPLPNEVSPVTENQIVEIVDKIIHAKKQLTDTYNLERQLDNIIYQLYNISDDERSVIEDV